MFIISGLELGKCLSEKQTGTTEIRLLFQKQSDLGLPCFVKSFVAGNYTVRNFRTFAKAEIFRLT